MLQLDYSVYDLARIADCGSPDSDTSPGAKFLMSIQDSVNETVQRNEDRITAARDIAAGAAAVYTHEKWSEFVDLCAYREDLSEISDGTIQADDLEEGVAGNALYLIADRLVHALFDEIMEDDTE